MMGLFGSKSKAADAVGRISVFPNISAVVLKKGEKLIVFNPRYLLGKHGGNSLEVASKFMNLRTAGQLLDLIDKNTSERDLAGSKVEVKEIDFGSDVGTDSLVELSRNHYGAAHVENIRGFNINVIPVKKGAIPRTRMLNIILVPFNPQFGDGVEHLFREKYKWAGFEDFKTVHAVVSVYPGRYAPPMSDDSFWSRHALLREI